MGEAMFSKSLIQFSVDGWGRVPSLLFTWGQTMVFPLWLRWLRIHLQCGRPEFDPWDGKIPWRRERLPTPSILVWRLPWGCKELDTTKRLSLSPTIVEVMKTMATSFKRSHAFTVTLSAPRPAAGHCQPTPPPETPVQESLCPPRVCFPGPV